MNVMKEAKPGVAGRTDYAQWDKVTQSLVEEVEKEEQEEIAQEKAKLGLDGKYAVSEADAEERKKAQDVADLKKKLDAYKKRESSLVSEHSGLLGPVSDDPVQAKHNDGETKSKEASVVRLTRDHLNAGERVITISDTSGASVKDKIILTQDLSSLESKMNTNAKAKAFDDDAENAVAEKPEQRSIYGIIKAFLNNVHNCTVIIRCKIISGVLEIHNCSNIVVRIESTATVATIQADLSQDVTVEFHDAPSSQNKGLPGMKPVYWGESSDDRIFHAGVNNMTVKLYRDGFVESETTTDYLKDGAVQIGNATPEEMQFITSVVDGNLLTEKVVRSGQSTGKNVRAMTQREIDEEQKLREKAATMAIAKAEEMIRIQDKDGNEIKKVETAKEEIQEVFTPAVDSDVQDIVSECEQNKSRGNEAFGAGEYGQAILLYSLALDKAAELPESSQHKVPRDVLLSNRAAAFLKLGQHEKAEEDASNALAINPDNIKANFRRGLALHAMARYYDALPVLAKAHKIEPKNKQVKQALQFCEVRIQQDQRKRMEG